MGGPNIERRRDGTYRLRFSDDERTLLAELPAQLRELLGGDDPSLVRLFPPAYAHDEASDDEYRRLMRAELMAGKLAALDVLAKTASADTLDEEQLEGWLGALESLRLVLGTQLDVTETTFVDDLRPDDPDAPLLAVYAYLSWLQEQAVDALSGSLPDP